MVVDFSIFVRNSLPAPLNSPKGGTFDAYFAYFMTIIFKNILKSAL
jgi:hypothetical protein